MKRKICFSVMKKTPQIPMIEMVELPFFVSYVVYLVYMILDVTFYSQYIASIWKPIYIMCIGLLGIYELIKNGLTLKNIIAVSFIMLLFVNITRVGQGSTQNAIASLLFYMFCARDISFKKISWFTLWISGLLVVFIVASSFIGIIPNYVVTEKRHREYLGFLYALYGPTIMSNISLLWFYRKKEKITISGVLILSFANYFFYKKTDSRLCFFLTVLLLVYGLFLRKHGKFVLRRKAICYGMIFSFFLACILSFGLTINYQPSVPWMKSLNSILGTRLSLGKESLSQIGIKPLGIAGIKWVGNGLNMYGEKSTDTYLYVDSYYIQIAQRFGYVFLIIMLFILTIAAYKAYKQKDIYLLSILSLLAVHFIIDDLYMYLHYNTFWLAAGALVFSKKRPKECINMGIKLNSATISIR